MTRAWSISRASALILALILAGLVVSRRSGSPPPRDPSPAFGGGRGSYRVEPGLDDARLRVMEAQLVELRAEVDELKAARPAGAEERGSPQPDGSGPPRR